jgi:hypothetical protein
MEVVYRCREQLWRYLINSHGQPARGGHEIYRVGEGPAAADSRELCIFDMLHRALDVDEFSEWKVNMRFGTGSVRRVGQGH